MTLPTTSISWGLATELADRLAVALDPAKVYPYPPSERESAKEVVWLADRSSEVTVPVSTAARRQRDELVTLAWGVWVDGRRNVDDAASRFAEIVAVAENLCADDVFLGGLAGVTEAWLSEHRTETCEPTPTGAVCAGSFTIQVQTRLI